MVATDRVGPQATSLPGPGGEISLWVCQLHGLSFLGQTDRNTSQRRAQAGITELLGIVGLELSPEKIRRNLDRSNAIQSGQRFQDMIEAATRGDSAKFNAGFKEIAQGMVDEWLPNFELPFDLSLLTVLQMRRAWRATLVATALFRLHPLILISKAWKGDRDAVLDLVRIDRLFLQDRCTQEVIKNAALRNDQQFMDQLASAQTYHPRVRRRDLVHIYLDMLFVLESMGQRLPRTDEVQRLLDPQGSIFRGVYAFERDLQRRRERFNKMFAEAYSEFPALLSFYQSASPRGA